MAHIERYVLVDRDDNEEEHEYSDFEEAKTDAQAQAKAVVARIYEYSDSELLWTPDGGDIWPPETDEAEEVQE